MGLLTIFCGLAAALVGLGGYFVTVIRDAEDILPDYEKNAPISVSQAEN
jgi:hypothetical protein